MVNQKFDLGCNGRKGRQAVSSWQQMAIGCTAARSPMRCQTLLDRLSFSLLLYHFEHT